MKLPIDLALHQKSRELELTYEGEESVRLSYEFLRVFSPSAEVTGHTPDEAVLQVGKQDVKIVSVEPIGNYALKITFSDGHDSGLFTWDYLAQLAQEKQDRWAKYLQDLEAAGASRDPAKNPQPAPKAVKHSCSH